jgi:hypothetical protein
VGLPTKIIIIFVIRYFRDSPKRLILIATASQVHRIFCKAVGEIANFPLPQVIPPGEIYQNKTISKRNKDAKFNEYK